MVGRTRIHLDQVRGLGHFMELEVMLGAQESTQAGIAVAHDLMAQLGIGAEQLIDAAYLDLLNQKK